MLESRSTTLLESAYVLHRRPFRETSVLIDVLTYQHGLLRLVARGINRSKPSKTAMLQPFLLLKISWTGRSQLPTLTDIELTEQRPLIGRAVLCGMYVNELLARVMAPGDPHPRLFVAYRDLLAGLLDQNNAEPALRHYELLLLEELGYAPTLDFDANSGEPVLTDSYYDYLPEHGPVQCDYHPRAFKGSTLLNLQKHQLTTPSDFKEAKRLMRGIINQILGNRPLKSRELFRYTQFE